MEAIRCKSSSQVGSQVMIPFGFLLIFLVVGASSTPNAMEKLRSYYAEDLDKYEYCVKLIVACEKLRDKVETFEESDEFNEDQDEVDAGLNKYKRFGCIPSGLSLAGLRSYLNLVSKWERQVHELFLLQNLFSVIEEYKGGLNMKVTFGKLQGWCPTSDEPQEIIFTTISTTSAEEAPTQTSTLKPELVATTKKNNVSLSVRNITDSCQVSSDVERWVHNEINGLLNMSSLTDRFSDFEKLLWEYRNQSCCSYKSIRDRVEIINYGIDILEELQDLKPSEKKDYADMESDYRNLNSRLEHLRTGSGYSSGKCCPDFSINFKTFRTDFQNNINEFNPPKTNITLKDLLKNVTNLEDTCTQQQNQLRKSIEHINNTNNKIEDCCGEEANKIKLIENALEDISSIKPQQDLSENINSVTENLEKSNKNLSEAENMLVLEAKEIEKLKNECGKIGRIQESKTLIDVLSLNVNKLVNKLEDIAFIRTVDLSKLNPPFDSLQNAKTAFEGINSSSQTNNTEKQRQDMENLNNTFSNVNMIYSNFNEYHELYQETAKKEFQKYRKNYDDLKESIKAIEASPQESRSKDGEFSKADINKLEKDLVNLSDNAIPKMALEIKDQRKYIADKVEKTITRKVEEKEQQARTWFNEEIKRKKQQILDRIEKLKQNKVNSEKLRQLETHILQLSERHDSLAKRIADRHEVLKENVKEMNNRIAAASSIALSCHQDCSLDNFPTMDALAKRVKVLEQQLQIYLKKIGKN